MLEIAMACQMQEGGCSIAFADELLMYQSALSCSPLRPYVKPLRLQHSLKPIYIQIILARYLSDMKVVIAAKVAVNVIALNQVTRSHSVESPELLHSSHTPSYHPYLTPLNHPLRNTQPPNLPQHLLNPRIQRPTRILIPHTRLQILLHLRHPRIRLRTKPQLNLHQRFERGI